MLAISAGVVVIDQISKAVIAAWLAEPSGPVRFEIWDPILALEYARNSGAAFGLLRDQVLLLTAIAFVIAAWLIVVAGRNRERSPWQTTALGLVAGGAIGNVIDRLRLGHVVDFIDVGRWPTFNLADSAITVGIGIAIIVGFRQPPEQRRDRAEGQRDSDSMA